MYEVGDMIVDKEGCAIITEVDKGMVKLEWNRKDDNLYSIAKEDVDLLIKYERWKVQKA